MFLRILQARRRRITLNAVAATLVTLFACGGDSPTVPSAPPTLTLTCPANVETSSLGGASVPVNFTTPSPVGGTPPVQVTCTPASGTSFPAGSSTVTCSAIDTSGRSVSCGFQVNVLTIARLSRTKFMSFGDSLTEGKISITVSMLVDSPQHSYPYKLLRLLRERYTGQEITLVNEGLGGERVIDSGPRFRAALTMHRPEVVLLMHGVNDLNGVEDGRVQAAVDGVEDLVKQAQTDGLAVFVATLPPFGPGPKAGCPECVVPFNDRLRGMVQRRGATLVDVYGSWGSRSGLMGADGIHPTEAGYDVIASTFFETIRRALEVSPSTP